MTKSHKILSVFGIILFIGIVVPKLTVQDVISLTAEEKSCVQTSIRQQFDHPLQRIALWLGKSAVMYKQGDGVIKPNTLIVKSYTIFRIPLPATRFFNRFTQHIICDWASEKTGGVFSEVAEFTESMQNFVIENFGHPIEGFNAGIYLNAFPGLFEADFNDVETLEGLYVYKNDSLHFVERGRFGWQKTSVAEMITARGHETLFENVQGRLGINLSADEVVNGIIVQGLGKVIGTILLAPTCPVMNPPDGGPPDQVCSDKPIFGEFIVQNAMGSVEFTRFGTARDGSFEVTLPAGEYYILWAEPHGLPGPGAQGQLVNVIAGETSEYTITLDTGIR